MAWEKSIRKRGGGGGRGEFTPHCELFHFFQITLFFFRDICFLTSQSNVVFSIIINHWVFLQYLQSVGFTNITHSALRESTHITVREKFTYAFYYKRKCEYLGVKLNEAQYENQLLENIRKCNPTPISHQYILSQCIIQISQGIQFQSITLKNFKVPRT